MGEGIYILNGLIYYCNMFSHILILIFNDAFCSNIFVYMDGRFTWPNDWAEWTETS